MICSPREKHVLSNSADVKQTHGHPYQFLNDTHLRCDAHGTPPGGAGS